MSLGALEHLEVLLLLGVTGLTAEFLPSVSHSRLEGTLATDWACFLHPWIPLIPVMPCGIGADVMSSTPLILDASHIRAPGIVPSSGC